MPHHSRPTEKMPGWGTLVRHGKVTLLCVSLNAQRGPPLSNNTKKKEARVEITNSISSAGGSWSRMHCRMAVDSLPNHIVQYLCSLKKYFTDKKLNLTFLQTLFLTCKLCCILLANLFLKIRKHCTFLL